MGNEGVVASDDSGIDITAEPSDPSLSFVIFHERESTTLREDSVRMEGLFPK